MSADEIVEMDGMRVSSPVRTWMGLARDLGSVLADGLAYVYGMRRPEPSRTQRQGAHQKDVPPGCAGVAWLPRVHPSLAPERG